MNHIFRNDLQAPGGNLRNNKWLNKILRGYCTQSL